MNYLLVAGNVDPNAPLIYMWEIRDQAGQLTGRYIGKANGGDKRPTRHYRANVNRLLSGYPYRNGKSYRRVHVALANATGASHAITLSFLCNVPSGQNIFEVEARYIREYGCDADDGIGLNGRWKNAPPAMALPAAILSTQGGKTVQEAPTDLEDFVEYVNENYSGRVRIESTPLRYTLHIGRIRILRAKVGGGRNRVYIKCVLSKKAGLDQAEFAWDGTGKQLSDAIDRELRLFREVHGNLHTA